jgi:hypothetical protein
MLGYDKKYVIFEFEFKENARNLLSKMGEGGESFRRSVEFIWAEVTCHRYVTSLSSPLGNWYGRTASGESRREGTTYKVKGKP